MRTNRWNTLLSSIADNGWDFVAQKLAGKRDDIELLCQDLLSTRGEASGIALARKVVETYEGLCERRKTVFFETLASGFQCNAEHIEQAIEIYRRAPSPETAHALAKAAQSPRLRLFRRINMAPSGTKAILRMRAFLLAELKQSPALAPIDRDLHECLEAWFNPGFLTLARIDWNSPASLLQRLREHEKVHEIHRLEDLRRRLDDDRRCFAFFHPTLPDEPLIFVQVALVKGIAQRVAPLLDEMSAVLPTEEADSAIFYSISTCEEGLRGVSLGNFLIKRVIALLKEELPHIKTFSTLSPVPGFRKWLANTAAGHDNAELSNRVASALESLSGQAWRDDGDVRQNCLELCAHYLVRERRGRMPMDAVARFHLGNGARLENINWLADLSPNGIEQSAGILVNYLYDEASIEKNHEALTNGGQVIHSTLVKRLLPTQSKPAEQKTETANAV